MATKYWAVFEGQGEGCDYTIGCNTSFCKLRATSSEDAKKEALKVFPLADCDSDTVGVERIVVLAVVEEYDLKNEIADEVARTAMERDAAAREKKLAQLEKLKRELGV